MRIKLWGSRGSIPAPMSPLQLEDRIRTLLREYAFSDYSESRDVDGFLETVPGWKRRGWGGNTLSVEVRTAGQSFIIDAGSGIRPLGYEMMKGPCGEGEGVVNLFLTHFHWDHLYGLCFFVPLFIPGNVVNIHAVQPDLEERVRALFRKPNFPLEFERLEAKVNFIRLEPRRSLVLDDAVITPYRLDHSDECWGYKVTSEGRTYSHCADTECVRHSQEELGEDLPLYQGVDLMLFDAQYTLGESFSKVDWGHATATLGIELAMREGIGKVLFTHHDPSYSDEKIEQTVEEAARVHRAQLEMGRRAGLDFHPVEWLFGYEGMMVEV